MAKKAKKVNSWMQMLIKLNKNRLPNIVPIYTEKDCEQFMKVVKKYFFK